MWSVVLLFDRCEVVIWLMDKVRILGECLYMMIGKIYSKLLNKFVVFYWFCLFVDFVFNGLEV